VDRELNLRGFKIASIENLGVTQDNYDTLEMSNNEITAMENFPLLRTLRTVLLSNNRIRSIAPNLGQFLPGVHTVMLTNNRIATLEALEPLADIPTITNLSLVGNPVSHNEQYRLFCIHLFPRLKILDFAKVKPNERKESVRIFGKSVDRKMVVAEEKTEPTLAAPGAAPTLEQRQRIKEMIQAATSLEEINRLSRMLDAGEVPEEAKSSEMITD
jgi:U2 small nuclear ribonucleoprotein A'